MRKAIPNIPVTDSQFLYCSDCPFLSARLATAKVMLLRIISAVLTSTIRGIAIGFQSREPSMETDRTMYALVSAVNIIVTPARTTQMPMRYFSADESSLS
jgi:hypothetical protein